MEEYEEQHAIIQEEIRLRRETVAERKAELAALEEEYTDLTTPRDDHEILQANQKFMEVMAFYLSRMTVFAVSSLGTDFFQKTLPAIKEFIEMLEKDGPGFIQEFEKRAETLERASRNMADLADRELEKLGGKKFVPEGTQTLGEIFEMMRVAEPDIEGDAEEPGNGNGEQGAEEEHNAENRGQERGF
ncbi:hypothetical protein K402DRAFT_465471 [Aulographum hederae CBS 113979]|uniref:Uncharacterized protein n=1 Tax=Aulographum hederae CBS 113979 TaxID=1176131 RepID=A0A6G1GTH5_9PEZI|nr:hypothetical protein K402DRAFT_465471 [Aulographum hederae CBS 113979]